MKSDTTVSLPLLAVPVRIQVQNDAVHLLPFVACSSASDNGFFCHAFAQLDVAANGNRVITMDALGMGSEGKLSPQTLLYLDASIGRWLYRDPCGQVLTGLAAAFELHYTTTIGDADVVPLFPAFGALGIDENRFDVFNFTVGLHAELFNQTDLRVAGVLPLRSGDDRFFDAEVQAALIRRF